MKRILLIGMGFYAYEQSIKKEMEKMGFEVSFILDRPNRFYGYDRITSARKKAIDQDKYLKGVIKKLTPNFDIVLVLVGRHLNASFLTSLRAMNQNATFILYLWDDVARVANYSDVKSFYDLTFTFDNIDAEQYGFRFLPLYFLPEFRISKSKEPIYDVCTISSVHSDRLDVMELLVKNSDKSIKYNLFFVGGFFYRLKEMFFRRFRCLKRLKGFHYMNKPLNTQDTLGIMAKSISIVDIQHPTQRGLTSRTFEALASKTKLITTNSEISKYDFYNPSNIAIIDRNKPYIDSNFFKIPYVEIESDLIENYSLNHWITTLLTNI